ncbi:hypothetical protein HK405_008812, partial [Cladochytrium tenue]
MDSFLASVRPASWPAFLRSSAEPPPPTGFSPSSSAPPPPTNAPDGAAAVSAALQRHRLLAGRAHAAIRAGLDAEERGAAGDALALYRRGRAELLSALQVRFADVEDRRAAEVENAKMRANLERVDERIRELAGVSAPG